MNTLNASDRAALAFNAARKIVRHAENQGSDDSYLYTLDHDGRAFILTKHTSAGSVEFARATTNAELAAVRRRLPCPNDEGEGCGHYVAITDRADLAMRRR